MKGVIDNLSSSSFPETIIHRYEAISDLDVPVLGCAKSHYNVLDSHLIDSPTNHLVVIEDDFRFTITHDFLVKYLKEMDDHCKWDVIMLSATDPIFYRVDNQKIASQDLYKIIYAKSAAAYIVNLDFVQTLKNYFLESVTIQTIHRRILCNLNKIYYDYSKPFESIPLHVKGHLEKSQDRLIMSGFRLY